MQNRIFPAIVAASLAFSTVPAALAEEPATVENQEEQLQNGKTSSASTPGEGSSDAEIIAGVVVIAGVAAAIAGGLHWAVQQRIIPNPLPGIIPNPPAQKKASVNKPVAKPAPKKVVAKPAPSPNPAPSATYKNCTDVWNKLGRSIYRNDPGFQSKFDRDGDGVGCERDPR